MYKILPVPKDIYRKIIKEYLNVTDRRIFFIAALNKRINFTCVHGIDAYNTGKGGHLNLLIFLTSHILIEDYACRGASIGGHVNILEWLHLNGRISCNFSCLKNAVANGHINILRFYKTNGLDSEYKVNSVLWEVAASKGKINSLEWLAENGCNTECLCRFAANNGHFDALKYLFHKCPDKEKHKDLFGWAAGGGNVEMLIWLRDNDIYIDSYSSANFSAQNGKINVLEWLHKNNYPLGERFSELAVNNGHINILDWVLENGFKCNINECCLIAVSYNQIEVLKCVKRNNKQVDKKAVYKRAVEYRRDEVIKWMRNNGWYDEKWFE